MEEKKLYLWREVLTDYTDGVVFCWATSEQEARELMKGECGYMDEEDFEKAPEVHDQTSECFAFVLWGGG